MPLSYAKNKAHIYAYRASNPESIKASNEVQRARRLALRQEEEDALALHEGRPPKKLTMPGRGRPRKSD